MIDQTDQAEPLGDRDDIRRQQHLPVIPFHPYQTFVERGPPRARLNHRLVGHHDPPLVERGNDLVGDADIDAALGVAFDIRPPHRIRPGAAALGAVERLVGAVDRLIGVARVAGHADRADRRGDRDRARLGRHHVVANGGQKPLGGDVHVVDGAVLEDQAELVAGEAAEHVAAAQPGADAARDLRDHGIGDIEAEGVIDARQMVDPDQHEGAGGTEARGFLDCFGERGDQMGAVELAGQGIVPRQLQELFVASMAFVVDADNALGARWLANRSPRSRSREPTYWFARHIRSGTAHRRCHAPAAIGKAPLSGSSAWARSAWQSPPRSTARQGGYPQTPRRHDRSS